MRVNVTFFEFPKQSETLAEAVAMYKLRAGRNPPQNYDKWFKIAKEKKCFIDEYDQIYADVAPFHLLSKDVFNARLKQLEEKGLGLIKLVIKDGKLAESTGGYFSSHLFKKV